ncbi:MAG TPA: hypothetical protein VEU07_02865 [Candidatus Acidoferrum sp.]|nr:hypothetical protein [Candidatus Acidoferrum sp.]
MPGAPMDHSCIIQGECGLPDDGYQAVVEITAHLPIPDSNAVRGLSPWITTVLPCPDCGQTMIWAEKDHAPGHRICNGCGSHWSVTPQGIVDGRDRILIQRARFYQPTG